MNNLVTVFLPVFNKEQYIKHCIDSVFMQIVNFNYEILIIDDCSTDNSVEIVKGYIQNYPDKIKFIQNEKNIKTLATSIKGYNLIKTKYFTVLDPDDHWLTQDKMQNAINFLEKHPDFTMYASNTLLKKEGEERQDVFICSEDVDFDFNSQDKIVSGHTSGTFFRNIFNVEKLKELEKYIGTKDETSFEGDSFRNFLHLSCGKGHFTNRVESVYNINKKGIWTSLDSSQQTIENSRFFLNMFLYFNKEQPYFLKKSMYLLRLAHKTNCDLADYQNINDQIITYSKEARIDICKNNNFKLNLKTIFYSTILTFTQIPIINLFFSKRFIGKMRDKFDRCQI